MEEDNTKKQSSTVDDDSALLKQLTTIPKRLQYFSEVHPKRELFIFCSPGRRESFTAGRLLEIAGKFAGLLVEQGFKPGDVFASILPNSVENLITILGVILAGGTFMSINPVYADGHDFFSVADRSGCRAVIMSADQTSSSWNLVGSSLTDHSDDIFYPLSCDRAKDLTKAIVVRPRGVERSFRSVIEESQVSAPAIDLCQPDDNVVLFTTSASTGTPKMVARTHRELLGRLAETVVTAIDDSQTSTRGVVVLNSGPLGWPPGFPMTTFAYGDTRVVTTSSGIGEQLTSPQLVDVIIQEKCNLAFFMFTQVYGLAPYVKDLGLDRKLLRTILTGATPVHKAMSDAALSLADTVVILYGAVETTRLSFFSYTKESEFVNGCCGKPLAGVEVRVMDGDRLCRPREIGDVHLKAPGLFPGYFNVRQSPDPDTAKTQRPDGWLEFGDYGYVDQFGQMFILGRTKDVIVQDTMKFYPSTLESKLCDHPDVLEAIVLPVSDPFRYQNICACVKVKEESHVTSDDLSKFCCSLYRKHLDAPPVPEFYLIFHGSEFPYQRTGKADRRRLRDMAETTFGKKGEFNGL